MTRTRNGMDNVWVVVWIIIADLLFLLLMMFGMTTTQLGAQLVQAQSDQQKDRTALDELLAEFEQQRLKIATLSSERDALMADRNKLRAQLALAKREAEAVVERERLERELVVVEARLVRAETHLRIAEMALEQTTVKLTQANIEKQTLERSLATARSEIATLKTTLAVLEKRQQGVHQQLLGLVSTARDPMGKPTVLGHVVLLVDTSGSLGLSGRWDPMRCMIADWVEHLAADEITLVRFGGNVELFPAFEPGDKVQRERLVRTIRSWRSSGGTPTLEALKRAYAEANRREVNAIVLFTDGEPDEKLSDIYDLVRKDENVKIPINVVAIGDYFKEKRLSEFLLELARMTGGSFQGR